MPYAKEPKTLETLITQSLQDSEIQKNLLQSGLTAEFLKYKLRKDHAKIWEAGLSEIEFYDREEKELQAKELELEQRTPKRSLTLAFVRQSTWTLLGFGFIGIVIYSYMVFWLKDRWDQPFIRLIRNLSLPEVPVVVVPFLSVYPLTLGMCIFLFWLLTKRLKSEQRDFQADWEQKVGKYLRKSIEQAKENIESVVRDRGILPRLRELISSQLAPSYETTLGNLDAPGLAEVFDPVYEVDTNSKERLGFMLENMPGGSIGVAGARGAGKTTLIWSFCRGSFSKIKGQPVLSVMTSAPVQYEARDFILHLFSMVCYRTLELEGVPDARSAWKDAGDIQSKMPNSLVGMLQSTGPFLLVVGGIMIALGILMATFSLSAQEQVAPSSSTVAPSGQLNQSSPPSSQSAVTSTATPQQAAGSKPSGVERYLRALGLDPGFLFKWGLVLVGLFYLSFYIGLRYRKRESAKYYRGGRGTETFNTLTKYADDAIKLLRDIKFQQSFTSGWSGALKIPIGLEGSVNSAVSLAQQQMSLPEVVDTFRNFLVNISQKYQVIIGIDELDKLESDEKAQTFLNEIKAIFGLERCFFLISVSESAMSNFERRGLPFRDVFDSSFDNIIYVDYLNLQMTKRLLARRVIGLPVPFLCFCYCLSGGLPRDLIRVARNVLELAQGVPTKDLLTLCRSVLSADLRTKMQAVAISAKEIVLEPEVSSFLEKLYRLETAPFSTQSLLEAYKELLTDFNTGLARQKEEPDEIAARRERLARIDGEMATYIYYTATILQFFGESFSPASLKAAETSGALDRLTRARQSLTVNPSITRAIVGDFRETQL